MTANTLLGVNNLPGVGGGIAALNVTYPIWVKQSEISGSVGSTSASLCLSSSLMD